MNVSYHVFKDYTVRSATAGSDEDIAALQGAEAKRVRRLRYSFVTSVYHSKRKLLYLGATNTGGDILVAFNPSSGKFKSLGFGKWKARRDGDVKIHKGMCLDTDNDRLYFGTATLDPLPKLIGKPGGLLAYCDLRTGLFHSLGRPLEGVFFQSTCWDIERGLVYLFTDRCDFAVYDFRRRVLLCRETMESIPHNSCLDDAGGVWGTYGPGKHGFFRYNGNKRKFEFPKCELPNAMDAANIQYPGAGPIDGMINGGDGYLYIGTALGELCRLDPCRNKIAYLGKPFPTRRLPGLMVGADGFLYVCGGYRPHSYLARYDRERGTFETLGQIRHADGNWIEYAHEIVEAQGGIYALETDNMTRGGYLWECSL